MVRREKKEIEKLIMEGKWKWEKRDRWRRKRGERQMKR
jgi:hypothetical protein